MSNETNEYLDVLVVGAGISGISAGYHLQHLCPGQRYDLLEAREHLRGTWDTFLYPAISPDSAMSTFGHGLQRRPNILEIRPGDDIPTILNETARGPT